MFLKIDLLIQQPPVLGLGENGFLYNHKNYEIMGILDQAFEALNASQEIFKVIAMDKTNKFLATENKLVLSVKNVKKAVEDGLLSKDNDILTLMKGRAFTNAEGITFFTDKASTSPTF
jgi:hypothetical protein